MPEGIPRRLERIWSLEHDPEKWMPVFPKSLCSAKNLERDIDSTEGARAPGNRDECRCAMRRRVCGSSPRALLDRRAGGRAEP